MNKFFVIIISIALLGSFGYFYLYPSYSSWQSNLDELKEVKKRLENRNEYFAGLKEINEKTNDYEENIEKLNNAIPDRFSYPKLYNFLQQKAAEDGLVVHKIQGKKIESKESTSTLPHREYLRETEVDLSVTGSYTDFKKYIKNLENSSRLFNIKEVLIKTPKTVIANREEEDREEEDIPFPFQIKFKVYSYKNGN